MDYPTHLSGVEIAGVYVHEPGGFISNVAVCITSFILVYLIGKPENGMQKNWKLFILFIGLGAFGGSFTHGLPTYLGEKLFFWVWAIKNSFVPVANYFAALDVLPKKKWIRIVLAIKAALVIGALFISAKFLPAVADLGLTYLMVIYFAHRLINKNSAYRYIRNAFIIGLLSGSFYIIKYDLDRLWFTHKDMVHVFVIISLLMIYTGVKKAGLRTIEPKEYRG